LSPRRRSRAKSNWPANLYERKGYYTWRNPQTREEFGLGDNKAYAFAEAVAANLHLATQAHKQRVGLVAKLTGEADRSVLAWSKKYETYLGKQDFAENTRRQYASMMRRTVAMYGPAAPLASVTALLVSDGLEAVAVTEGKPRTAQALRNFQRDFFREAIVQGWLNENPVRETKLTVPVVVKRARLSFEVFMQVYERTSLDWLRNAMALALVSAQRREDISNAQFAAIREGGWWCVQESEKSKDPHRILIPLDLKLRRFPLSLWDVVAQCRRTGVVSRYLVHQTRPRGNSPVGSQIWIDTISRRFTDALSPLKLDWGDKTPPTFHEIRSLAVRLYDEQGGVNTKDLAGHLEEETTDIYRNNRGSEWVRITTGG
jgi:hypothetical protein